MDLAERILRIESVLMELKQIACYASPIRKELGFEPSVRLHAETSQLVIEQDKAGNT